MIDRDGQIFRHILYFLRYGKLILPQTFNEYPALLYFEADFFQLESLKEEINHRLPRYIHMDTNVSFSLCWHGQHYTHATHEVILTRRRPFCVARSFVVLSCWLISWQIFPNIFYILQ